MTTQSGAEPRTGCTVDADGRITFGMRLSSASHPRLLLRLRPKKGQPEKARHLLDLEPGKDGHRSAVLRTGQTLEEGRWDVYLLSEPDGERQRLRPGPADLRALVDGSGRDWSPPIAVRVPYITKSGHLAVRAWLRTAHAEADRILITDRSMTVTARLHGVSFGPGAAVRMVLRGTDTVRTAEPRIEGDGRGFSFAVGCEELAGPASSGGVWDAFVQPAAEAPSARIGRLLDDVADRKEIFVYPSARIGASEIRPYYTVDNDLSVEVTRPG